MKKETKAKLVKLGAKTILKLTGVELLGEGGVFLYDVGKDYLPESAKKLIGDTIDGGIDLLSDEAGDFTKNYLTQREKVVNFQLARGICKVWEESLTASLPQNRVSIPTYTLLPQHTFQDYENELKFFISKFKKAQEDDNEDLLIDLFYDKDKSEEDFSETFFTGVQNTEAAEDAYFATLQKTLIRWAAEEDKSPAEWQNGFPAEFSREMKKFLFGNLRLGLEQIFARNEEFQKAFEVSADLLIMKSLQNLPKEMKVQFEKAQGENRSAFHQIQEQFSKLELSIENISKAIHSQFDAVFDPETVNRIDANTQETNENVKQLLAFLPQIIELLKNQPKRQEESFKGFHTSFPRVPNFFTGRKEVLEELEKTLEIENQASFYGTHGLGKTRTAIEYAFRHEEDYDFILFISATKGNFVNNAAIVGTEISEAINKAETLKSKYNLFIEYLRRHPNWLIIVDNVESVREITSKIPKHFVGNVIYTSNLREIEDIATHIKIEAMMPNEAQLTLLRRKTGNNAASIDYVPVEERKAITKIVEKIGTLPIGLNLAGAFIKKYQINFSEYLEDYEIFEAATFQNFDLADYYGEEFLKGLSKKEKEEYKGIAGVFLLSYQRIIKPKDHTEREKQISETIKAILNLSVFLAPEKVPEEIWKEGLSLIDETLAKASENKLFWLEVGKRLTQSAFFVRNEDDNTSTTHRLILSILQKQLNDEEKRKFAEIAVNVINTLWVSSIFEHWTNCNRLLRHAETALNYTGNLEIEIINAARLYNQIANYLYYLADYEKSVLFLQKALAIDEKTIGKEHTSYANDLNNLAEVYSSQGKYDNAIELFKQVLLIGEKTIGKKHRDYATFLNNLAGVYRAQGKYDKAIKLLKQALAISKKTVGKNHPVFALRLNNLAEVYRSQGKYDEAIELFKQALLIAEKTIGKEHPNYATHLNNLALVYDSQGRYEEAIELYKQALSVDEKTIGKEHPEYATHLNNLAGVYRSQDKYDEALQMYEEVERIFVKFLGEDHPLTQMVKRNLEICRNLAGKD